MGLVLVFLSVNVAVTCHLSKALFILQTSSGVDCLLLRLNNKSFPLFLVLHDGSYLKLVI
jgi:hypothetical protein